MKIFWGERKIRRKGPCYDGIKYIASFGDAPNNLGNIIFFVKDGTKKKWVLFNCPNDCGVRVEVNLMESMSPFWHFRIKRGKISLYPSIIVKNCKTHFWLIDNEINWSYDNEFE